MKHTFFFFFVLATLLSMSSTAQHTVSGRVSSSPRSITLFDANWKFIKEDPKDAEKVDFNDAAWRALNLPHDWGIEGTYDRTNPTGRGGGYVQAGIGWYRKNFELKEADARSRIFIEFDGVMMNSDVWINGQHLGKRPYGYSTFQYEMTGHLNFGKGHPNILAVRVDNSVQPASRWYTGSGIYRHTRLVITNPVHVDHWGVFVHTLQVSAAVARVQVQTAILNQSGSASPLVVETTILSPEGTTVKAVTSRQSVPAKASQLQQSPAGGSLQPATSETINLQQEISVDNPELWSLEQPRLYTAVTRLRSGTILLDETTTPFGIRDARFDAATGFWLNGKNIKIKGVCLHHDGGAVGAAVPLRVWERRLELLRRVGANAIRTSHNPPAPEFLDLCDRMGFLVLDETFDTWNARKSNAEKGYNLYFSDWWEKDTHDMIVRDRNHPSIILYSVGNEIHDNLNDTSGFRKYKMQQDLVHALDPTRPVTMALFRPAISHVYENGLAASMDVVGQNYRENELVAAHEAHPSWKVIGTENGHTLTAWLALRDKLFMAGQFLWVGFDYLGEADWPALVNGQGVFDRTGGARNITFQRQSWWSDRPMVFAMRKEQNAGEGAWVSDWTPADIDTYDDARIQVYSNCDEVELFLNGKSHGIRPRPADNASPRTWQLTFEKGTLKVEGRNNGQAVATQELTTADSPASILLTADKGAIANNWDDLSYITATIVDEKGTPCPAADNQLTFNVNGAGFLAGVDNADLSSTESFLSSKRFAFKGTCIAIVKANGPSGKITVTATAQNLKEGNIVLTVDGGKK
jgi:beta-galactosidase